MSTWLSYRPGSDPLRRASAPAAISYLAAPCVIAFLYDSPLVLAGAGGAMIVAGLAAGAAESLGRAARWGLVLALLMAAVNALVTSRGLTVLARGPVLPVLGPVDVTLEALAAGGVIGLRILVVVMAFSVYSSCVDPDRVLRLLRPLAHRSALTAALAVRGVPLAAADSVRLREAAALRGPAAAAVDRAALIRRLVAGSLDRAVDAAATLELRGYGSGTRLAPGPRRRSRHGRAFALAAALMMVAAVAVRVAGGGGFEAYPRLELDAGPATLAFSAVLVAAAGLPFVLAALGGRRRGRA